MLMQNRKGFQLGLAGAATVAVLAACSGDTPADTASAERFYCAAQPIEVLTQDGAVLLTVGEREYQLTQVQSATGARYANDDPDNPVQFWSRGERASLEIGSRSYAECTRPGAILEPHIARGNEPFWLLEVNEESAVLRRMGEDEQSYSVDERQWQQDGRTRITASQAGDANRQLVYEVTEDLCQDSMSGMFYPQSASLQVGDDNLTGCAGAPQRLLESVDWKVTRIGKNDVSEYDISVRFGSDGSVSGRAACNRYFGPFELTGESLQFGELAGTKMACDERTMRAEYNFMGALSAVHGFSIERKGNGQGAERDTLWLETERAAQRLRLEHPRYKADSTNE